MKNKSRTKQIFEYLQEGEIYTTNQIKEIGANLGLKPDSVRVNYISKWVKQGKLVRMNTKHNPDGKVNVAEYKVMPHNTKEMDGHLLREGERDEEGLIKTQIWFHKLGLHSLHKYLIVLSELPNEFTRQDIRDVCNAWKFNPSVGTQQFLPRWQDYGWVELHPNKSKEIKGQRNQYIYFKNENCPI